ncbi:hypothetical protein OH805_24190 [Streptomyces sp. NBC_00879]|uniref:hypothetical protein n=1 Tax=Streptomyces sp. NBC_00879 TaxID=2975855 RepID=UPI00386D0079|nr:hypothetical protein OH805_24190 [Streptomyces sp. NBC_00879]
MAHIMSLRVSPTQHHDDSAPRRIVGLERRAPGLNSSTGATATPPASGTRRGEVTGDRQAPPRGPAAAGARLPGGRASRLERADL